MASETSSFCSAFIDQQSTLACLRHDYAFSESFEEGVWKMSEPGGLIFSIMGAVYLFERQPLSAETKKALLTN